MATNSYPEQGRDYPDKLPFQDKECELIKQMMQYVHNEMFGYNSSFFLESDELALLGQTKRKGLSSFLNHKLNLLPAAHNIIILGVYYIKDKGMCCTTFNRNRNRVKTDVSLFDIVKQNPGCLFELCDWIAWARNSI